MKIAKSFILCLIFLAFLMLVSCDANSDSIKSKLTNVVTQLKTLTTVTDLALFIGIANSLAAPTSPSSKDINCAITTPAKAKVVSAWGTSWANIVKSTYTSSGLKFDWTKDTDGQVETVFKADNGKSLNTFLTSIFSNLQSLVKSFSTGVTPSISCSKKNKFFRFSQISPKRVVDPITVTSGLGMGIEGIGRIVSLCGAETAGEYIQAAGEVLQIHKPVIKFLGKLFTWSWK